MNPYAKHTWLFPRERKACPSRTREQEVSLFRSSVFAILKDSLRNRLLGKLSAIKINIVVIITIINTIAKMSRPKGLTWRRCVWTGRKPEVP